MNCKFWMEYEFLFLESHRFPLSAPSDGEESKFLKELVFTGQVIISMGNNYLKRNFVKMFGGIRYFLNWYLLFYTKHIRTGFSFIAPNNHWVFYTI